MYHQKTQLIKTQQGFSLIEMLAAVTITTVGLLGLASLHLEAMKKSNEAFYKTLAIMHAEDMMERMASNMEAVEAGAFNASVDENDLNDNCYNTQAYDESHEDNTYENGLQALLAAMTIIEATQIDGRTYVTLEDGTVFETTNAGPEDFQVGGNLTNYADIMGGDVQNWLNGRLGEGWNNPGQGNGNGNGNAYGLGNGNGNGNAYGLGNGTNNGTTAEVPSGCNSIQMAQHDKMVWLEETEQLLPQGDAQVCLSSAPAVKGQPIVCDGQGEFYLIEVSWTNKDGNVEAHRVSFKP